MSFLEEHKRTSAAHNSCQNISFKGTNESLIMSLDEKSVASIISIYFPELMSPSSREISAWTNQQAQSHVTIMAKNKVLLKVTSVTKKRKLNSGTTVEPIRLGDGILGNVGSKSDRQGIWQSNITLMHRAGSINEQNKMNDKA